MIYQFAAMESDDEASVLIENHAASMLCKHLDITMKDLEYNFCSIPIISGRGSMYDKPLKVCNSTMYIVVS